MPIVRTGQLVSSGTINNETEDFDALHDPGEVIEPLPKRCSASIRARRKLANGIWMKGQSGDVVVANGLDVRPHHPYHLFAHTPPGVPQRRNPEYFQLDRWAPCPMSSQPGRRPSRG